MELCMHDIRANYWRFPIWSTKDAKLQQDWWSPCPNDRNAWTYAKKLCSFGSVIRKILQAWLNHGQFCLQEYFWTQIFSSKPPFDVKVPIQGARGQHVSRLLTTDSQMVPKRETFCTDDASASMVEHARWLQLQNEWPRISKVPAQADHFVAGRRTRTQTSSCSIVRTRIRNWGASWRWIRACWGGWWRQY